MQKIVDVTFHVRYAETDQMGIVHHANYVVWLEEGRSSWLRQNGHSYADFEAYGFRLIVSELYARYHQPARYDQRVTIRCWVEDVRTRQLRFGYDIFAAETGERFVTAYSKHICVDHSGKVRKLPDRWRTLMEWAVSNK